jgi:hypothetical protein
MTKRDIILAAGFVAALAFAGGPAMAQSIDISDLGGGNSSASTGGTGTTTADAETSGGGAFGGSGPTTANLSLGGDDLLDGSGPVTGVATIGDGTTSGSPSGSVVIGTGSTGLGGTGAPLPDSSTATIVLNPDGTISVGTGPGTAPGTTPGTTPPGGFTPEQVQAALANLSDEDVAALKLKCKDILANPGGFDAAAVGLCNVLASG